MVVAGLYVWYQGSRQIDIARKGWDDPVTVSRLSHDPFVGGIFAARYDEKLAEENLRRWNDRYRHTGETWRNSKYPWTAYRNTEGSNTFGPGDYFEASERVIMQGSSRLKRWF